MKDAMRHILPESLITVAVIAILDARPGDWPQFLGPDRNGTYAGPLANAWPANGPRTVWRRRVGEGLAGPVVTAGRLILFHRVAGAKPVGK